MTPQEALEIITNIVQRQNVTKENDLALAIVQKATEKQIPKKPDTETINRGIDVSGEYDIDNNYICPSCKSVVGDYEWEDIWYKHCPECGQAIKKE